MSTDRPDHPDGHTDGHTDDDADDTTGAASSARDPFEATVRAALAASAAQHTADPDLHQRIEAKVSRSSRPARFVLAAAAAVVLVVLATLAVRSDDQDQGLVTAPGTTNKTDVAPEPGTNPSVVPPPEATDSTTTVVPPPGLDASAVLRVRGIATTDFGGPTAEAERTITDLIGPPVARFTEADCALRQVISWGSFAIWDQGGQVTEWRLVGDPSLGLRTDRGIGIGSPSDDVAAAYPEAHFGEVGFENPARLGYAVADARDNIAWSAVLGSDERVVAMGSSPGELFPATCSGHGVSLVSLSPHMDGLGIVAFGTPAARATAVFETIYGAPTRSTDEDTATVCSVTTSGYGPGPDTQVLIAGGRFAGFRNRSDGSAPAAILDRAGTYLRVGLTIAEVRELTDAEVEVASEPEADGTYPVTVIGEPGASTRVVGAAAGTTDDAVLASIGAMTLDRVC